MTYRISIPISILLESAEAQTSVDFQGARAANSAADAVYDDFTMSRDNAPEAVLQVRIASAVLCTRFAQYVKLQEWSPEQITYNVNIDGEHDMCDRVSIFIQEYLKQCILAWWYMVRNSGLSERCAALAAATLDTISSQVSPSVCTRRLRMF